MIFDLSLHPQNRITEQHPEICADKQWVGYRDILFMMSSEILRITDV